MIKSGQEEVAFKSIAEYFKDEQKGLKNHTERIIDINDPRFQLLLRAWKTKDYPYIRIDAAEGCRELDRATPSSPNTISSFMRQVRHIAIWGNIMSITWEHDETNLKW